MNNLFKYTIRSLFTRKFFTLINISGLAIGIAVFLVLISYVRSESSYDHYHQKADRTYKLITHFTNQHGNEYQYSIVMGDVNEVIRQQVPEVEIASLMYGPDRVEMDLGGDQRSKAKVLYVDYSFLDVFDFPLMEGVKFDQPDQIIINQEFVKKAFENNDALGQRVGIEDKSFSLAGIVEVPKDTRFQFDALIPIEAYPYVMDMKSGGVEFESYFTLLPNGNNEETLHKIAATYNEFLESKWTLCTADNYLIPIKDVYLDDRVNHRMGNGNAAMLVVFLIVAMIIVILALMNYLNVQIAYSFTRRTEMKIRKVMGAGVNHLMSLSLVESMMVIGISGIIALLLVQLIDEATNQTAIKLVRNVSLNNWSLVEWSYFGAVLLTLIFISTIFSVRRMTQLKFDASLKIKALGNGTLAMIAFQFFITAGLLSMILFINAQMSYIQAFDRGYNEENVLVVKNLSNDFRGNFQTIKTELLRNPSILSVSGMQSEPGAGTSGQIARKASDPEEKAISINHVRTLGGYVETFGLNVVAGTDFSNSSNDQYQFIINETAASRIFAEGENPIGQTLDMAGRISVVVGVVQDYNYQSLRQKIQPLVIDIEDPYSLKLAIRLNSENISESIDFISKTLQTVDSKYGLEYSFVDEQFDRMYYSEIDSKKILSYATIVALVISLFGLLSMTIFVIQSKTKEMAMRKILGADVIHLFWQLSKKTFYCILAGNVLAVPMVYWFAQDWVSEFAFHISMNQLVWIVPTSLTISLIVAVFVVLQQLWKAVYINPVNYLRYE
ncbi:MAG: hypothetical protein CMB89_07320 [Flammeovirgaceae bacterium]|nr:hypothetical protein [Flammeovirgaceae bacterium]